MLQPYPKLLLILLLSIFNINMCILSTLFHCIILCGEFKNCKTFLQQKPHQHKSCILLLSSLLYQKTRNWNGISNSGPIFTKICGGTEFGFYFLCFCVWLVANHERMQFVFGRRWRSKTMRNCNEQLFGVIVCSI